MNRLLYLVLVPAIVTVVGCAKGGQGDDGSGSNVDGPACSELCDQDGDGVPDGNDRCPGTHAGAVVNHVGCADAQLTPTLQPMFPPYGLTWTPTGDLGRAGGLTWTYTGIQRADLFHIYWVVCDDPSTACGLSLDGAIDEPDENWRFSPSASDLPGGKLVFTNATHIVLADTSVQALNGRLTVTIVDSADAPIRFAPLTALAVTGRAGTLGAEITGTGFEVVARGEVQDGPTAAFMPYLDYYDAAQTPPSGGAVTISFGGSFYDK